MINLMGIAEILKSRLCGSRAEIRKIGNTVEITYRDGDYYGVDSGQASEELQMRVEHILEGIRLKNPSIKELHRVKGIGSVGEKGHCSIEIREDIKVKEGKNRHKVIIVRRQLVGAELEVKMRDDKGRNYKFITRKTNKIAYELGEIECNKEITVEWIECGVVGANKDARVKNVRIVKN